MDETFLKKIAPAIFKFTGEPPPTFIYMRMQVPPEEEAFHTRDLIRQEWASFSEVAEILRKPWQALLREMLEMFVSGFSLEKGVMRYQYCAWRPHLALPEAHAFTHQFGKILIPYSWCGQYRLAKMAEEALRQT